MAGLSRKTGDGRSTGKRFFKGGSGVARPTIEAEPELDAVQGEVYAGFTATADDAKAPYTFDVSRGELPPGIVLRNDGAVAGTPTRAGEYTAIIRATDANGRQVETDEFTITVDTNLEIAGVPVEVGVVDVEYAGFTAEASGGTEPYTYSIQAGELPAGITLDAETGEVAGTPTEEVTEAGIVIRVTDALENTADLAAFEIVVSAA